MSTERHPITPSRELAQQWTDQIYGGPGALVGSDDLCLAKLAAQWGADQELEACCAWLEQNCTRWEIPASLRDARRPSPSSLKEQALEQLREVNAMLQFQTTGGETSAIRRALEALDD